MVNHVDVMTELIDQVETLTLENTRLRAELAAVNNEFGSQTADWPEAWKRVAEIKTISQQRWVECERLRAEAEALRKLIEEGVQAFEILVDGGGVDTYALAKFWRAELAAIAATTASETKGQQA